MSSTATNEHPYASMIIKPQHRAKRAVLLKGPSGAGKTYQYRTLAEGGWRGLLVNINEHMETLQGLDVDLFPIQQLDYPLMLSERNPDKQDLVKLMEFLKSGQHEYDFVYFDSLMRYADDLAAYLAYERKLGGFDLWKMFGEKMKRVLKDLVSLANPTMAKPLHVVGTWGVEVAQDWEGKRAIVPIVDGKMVGPRIDYYFSDVLMLRKQQDATGAIKYVMYTQGTHEFDGKVSAAAVKLPAIIADPNLFRIIQLITQNSGVANGLS